MQNVSGERKASKNLQKNTSSNSIKCLQVVHTFSVSIGVQRKICCVIIERNFFAVNTVMNLKSIFGLLLSQVICEPFLEYSIT